MFVRFTIALLFLATAGCAGGRWPLSSKWAMDDAEYAEKYSKPYKNGERYPRMAKQIVDARHVAGKGGLHLGAMGQVDPASLGGEIGFFDYPTATVERRFGLAGLLGTSAATDEPAPVAYGGLNAGLRVQTPTRIAPFAGAGLFGGLGSFEVPADNDGRDNNNNSFIDEPNEVDDRTDAFAAIYPEVGVHAWLTPRTRMTMSAAYYISTEGRDEDFWMFGISFGGLGASAGERYVPPEKLNLPPAQTHDIERLPPP